MRRAALALAVCALAVPVVASADPAPGNRIDLKILLAAPSETDAVLASWKADLQREGVPFDVYVQGRSPALDDAALADYAAGHAKYNGVIVAAGDMLDAADQAALTKYERTFGVRQISDNVASATHGLTLLSSGEQGGQTADLTAAGKLVFPYLKGAVPISAPTFGYRAKPIDPTTFETLLTGPDGAAYLGVNTRGDGTQELVDTIPGSPYETQNQLLRHGMIQWVTRGIHLGTQRDHLETQIDDVFLGDDGWIGVGGVDAGGRTCVPLPETTSSCPEDQLRLAAADVAGARTWMRDQGLRLDMVYNGGGTDPAEVLTEFQKSPGDFGWINHTLDHPNLDCSTAPFIASQITDNTNWARANGLPTDPAELVTGEHSGLANTVPGNPGTIDPPAFEDAPTLTPSAGVTLAGAYDYGITGTTSLGETNPSITTVDVTAGNAVRLAWPAVCHTTSYKVYRRTASAGSWALIGTVAQPATAFGDAGPLDVRFTDTGAAGSAATPPAANGAAESPYGQNPDFTTALTSTGVKYTASDASKPYPGPPTAAVPATTQFAAGQSFVVGGARTIPRYPTNIYYNTGTQAQQLDEYNYLYNVNRGCKPIAGVTTCNTTDVTWQQLIDSETAVMLRHVLGNDPRPHYFHESNLANANANGTGGGVFYALLDNVLSQYRALFTTPLVQLSPTGIGDELARQDAWSAALTAGGASAYLQDGQVHITTAQTLDVPLTGTTVGDVYGGDRSGWLSVSGSADVPVGEPVAPASTPTPTSPQPPATSPPAGRRDAPGSTPARGGSSPGVSDWIKLKRLKIAPRRFRTGSRGATLTWAASGTGTLQATVRRLERGRRARGLCRAPTRSNRRGRACTRVVDVGSLRLAVTAGSGRTRFRARLGRHALRPGTYQLVAGTRTVQFSITKTRVKDA